MPISSIRNVATCLLLLSVLLLLASCAASAGSNSAFLLEQDYQRMNNAELTAYEQELNDELARASGGSPSGVSVGLGVGSWGDHTGFGLGVEKALGIGGDDGVSMELRDRRDVVRAEMRRRGLLSDPFGAR